MVIASQSFLTCLPPEQAERRFSLASLPSKGQHQTIVLQSDFGGLGLGQLVPIPALTQGEGCLAEKDICLKGMLFEHRGRFVTTLVEG